MTPLNLLRTFIHKLINLSTRERKNPKNRVFVRNKSYIFMTLEFLCLAVKELFLTSLKGGLELDGFVVLPSLCLDQSPLLLCRFSFNRQINTLFSDSDGNLIFSGSNLSSFLSLLISSCNPQNSACRFFNFASDDNAFLRHPST